MEHTFIKTTQTITEKKKLYLELYNLLDENLKNANICNFQKSPYGLLTCYGSVKGYCHHTVLCCEGCMHLNTDTGCTVKSLSCKIWLCSALITRISFGNYKQNKKPAIEGLMHNREYALQQIRINDIPCYPRTSMKRNFELK
jgi:hypothetical protein